MCHSDCLLLTLFCLTAPLRAGAELTYASFDPSGYYGPMAGPLHGKNRNNYSVKSVTMQDNIASLSQLVHVHHKTPGRPVLSFYNIWDDRMVIENIIRKAYGYVRYSSPSRVQKVSIRTMESRYCNTSTMVFQSRVAEALHSRNPLEKLSIYGYATYPGTRNCRVGALNQQTAHALPLHQKLDSCCQVRNKCPIQVYSGRSFKSLSSNSNIRKVACECDTLFRSCLQDIGDVHAKTVGALYYDLFEVNCLKNTTTCFNINDSEEVPCLLNPANDTTQRSVTDYEWSLGTGPFYSSFKFKPSKRSHAVKAYKPH